MKKILVANWKMNLSGSQSVSLSEKIKKRISGFSKVKLILAPAFPFLNQTEKIISGSAVSLAGQNLAPWKEGDYTGEVSADNLKEVGCSYAIVGHAERRGYFNENNDLINKKIDQTLSAGLTPILCVGENHREKEKKQTGSVLGRQIREGLQKIKGFPEADLIIAYEPVWAIGGEKSLDPEEMQSIFMTIKKNLTNLYSEKFFDEKVKVLYGGSVDGDKASTFWENDFVDGLLVGGAGLNFDSLYKVAVANRL